MSKVFRADDTVMAAVKDLVVKYHPHLVPILEEIAVVFKEKAATVGDNVVMGKTAKAPDLISVLTDKDFKFVITLAADEWEELNAKQKKALLDHHLCACRVKEDPATSEYIKFWVQPPDVAFFREEVERNGFWRTSSTPVPKTVLEDLFGEAEEEAAAEPEGDTPTHLQ